MVSEAVPPDAGLSRDRFLDGRVVVTQGRTGYRAGADPVLLAATVPAVARQAVLELGCGVGVASLCLGWRVPGLDLHGVERQPDQAELARRNAAENGIAFSVTTADLTRLPAELRGRAFDHVIANPPFFDAGDGTSARDPGREAALREQTPLEDWVDTGLRRLRPGGWLTMIQRADRLPGLLGALAGRAGDMRILPLTGRAGQPAGRVIVQARKGTRGPMRLLAPLILHDGSAHVRDGDDYSAAAIAVLRHGAALTLGSASSCRKGACAE